MDTKQLGNLGEDLACEYLVKNGYNILGRNYRINFGEIDIIARKRQKLFAKSDKTIHFVEVKTLSGSGDFYPEDRVDYKKQNKYKRLAEVWLSKNKLPEDVPYQIDIVSVSITGEVPKIDYFENVVEG
jgi:putative endonuclease